PYSQLLFVLAAAGIILNTLWVSPLESFIGVAIILVGLPVFWIWESRRKAGELASLTPSSGEKTP
ncbi:MAG: hypothetical protein ACRD21_26140, partial [Vicinamibacteria bacterium]